MKPTAMLCFSMLIALPSANAGTLCFSPVNEKAGDKSTERGWWQSFNYRVQIDDGPVVKPSAEASTPYAFTSRDPLVKIWLGRTVVESFRVSRSQIAEGRDCIYFKNLYETWSVVEAWQARKLCSCVAKEHNKPLQSIARDDARAPAERRR